MQTQENMESTNLYCIIFGVFSILALYNFFLYLGRKHDKKVLYFSLFNFSLLFFIITKRVLNQTAINPFILVILQTIALLILIYSTYRIGLATFDLKKISKVTDIFYIFIVITSFISILILLIFKNDISIRIITSILISIFALFYTFSSSIIILKTGQYKGIINKIFLISLFIGNINCIIAPFYFIINSYIPFALVYIPFIIMSITFSLILINQINKESRDNLKIATELKNLTKTLDQKVSERTKEIIDISNNRMMFFTTIAHEIRTPLQVEIYLIEKFLKKHKIAAPELDAIISLNHGITSSLTTILDISKLEKGENIYKTEKITDISKIVEKEILVYKESKAFEKNITIEKSIEYDLYTKASNNAIYIIINNLIDNAVKYTRENGLINITLKKEDNYIKFEVKDNGKGIPETKLSNIFEPFYQVNKTDGWGIGLYHVKNVINTIGGEIRVESIENHGATFTVHFQNHELQDNDIITNDEINRNNIYINELNNIVKHDKFIKSRKTLFIIEDNIMLLALLHEYFSDKYNVFTSSSNREAVKIIEIIPTPDIIICDVMMDGINAGFEFRKHLLLIDKFKMIPFIFMTAKASPEDELEGINLKAADYIKKPVEPEILDAKIANILNTSNKKNIVIDDSFRDKIDKIIQQFNLDEKEKKVLFEAIKGKSNKEISAELSISIKYVEKILTGIYKKTNAGNKIGLLNLFVNAK